MQDAGQDDRLTVADAAERLGISKEAIRKRISRGTLRSNKDPDGTVRVYVPPSPAESGTPSGAGQDAPAELVEELRDRIRFVEGQLEAEREAHREARRIIAGLVQRIPELEAPSEPRESPEAAAGEPTRTESRTGSEEPSEGREQSWWRRILGG